MEFLRIIRSRLVIVSALILGHSLLGHDSAGQDKPAALNVEYSAVNASGGGVIAYVPEKWGLIDLAVRNPFDEAREILSTTYFETSPSLQYGRRVWVPARARLATWLPVLLPKLPHRGEQRFNIQSVVFDVTNSQEVLQREEAGGKLHSAILPARVDRPVTGYIGPADVGTGQLDAAFELIVAGRLSQSHSRNLAHFDTQSRIPDDFSLQAVDQLVIANGRIHEDSVRLAAIRQWLNAGGLLWVMLDQTDVQVLERIVGDDFRCHVVDRVELTDVRIESPWKGSSAKAVESEYEQPVDFVRVAVAENSGIQVEHTVNGWPAAFWKPCGAGRLLVTTLGTRGWMRLRSPEDSKRGGFSGRGRGGQEEMQKAETDLQTQGRYLVLPPMADIAKPFFRIPSVPRVPIMDSFEAQSAEYVGHSIPPRWQIAGILTGFGGAVMLLGVWLLRKRALEHTGWTGSALSIAAAALLLLIGRQYRHAKPDTAAVVDFVQPVFGTDDVQLQGAVTFYRPEAGPWDIATTHGGRLVPDMRGLEGTTRRLVWSDLDAWSWQNLTQTAPLRTARFEQAKSLDQRIEARAALGPDGLIGRLSIPAAMTPTDAILATRSGQLGVELSTAGSFHVPADGVLGKNEYLAAGILSDEQDRRRKTNERLLQKLRQDDWPGPPLLILWTDQRISQFQFDAGRRLLGATLLAIPVRLERPPAGASVRVPAPLLEYRTTLQPSNEPSSPIWDYSRREWHEYAMAASVWLKFEFPRELLPLDLTGGRLVIQVTGPLGRLEVFGLHREPGDARPGAVGGQAVSIRVWDQPVGTLSLPLVDSSILSIGADGGFVLGLTVGGPEKRPETGPQSQVDEKPSYWQIEDLSLELTGRIVER